MAISRLPAHPILNPIYRPPTQVSKLAIHKALATVWRDDANPCTKSTPVGWPKAAADAAIPAQKREFQGSKGFPGKNSATLKKYTTYGTVTIKAAGKPPVKLYVARTVGLDFKGVISVLDANGKMIAGAVFGHDEDGGMPKTLKWD